jgi:hypothetical protein
MALSSVLQFPESQFKKFLPISVLRQAGIARLWKMTLGCWFHQILFKDSGLS